MKKIKYLFLVLAFTLMTSVVEAKGSHPRKSIDPNERAEQLKNRVNEIWEMDFSEINREEKVEIKKELKEIKKELKELSLDRKVSISVGAIIIILLLLIIIL